MRIASWNLNGIRAAEKAGFFRWLATCDADVVLLQEVRADRSVLRPEWLEVSGYRSFWHPAEKKGYSGVGIYTRLDVPPSGVFLGLGKPEFDVEGRVLGIVHHDTLFISAYFPNSQREGLRLPYKLAFCRAMLEFLEARRREGLRIVLGGDLNIAHKEIDLAHPKTNTRTAGFLPEERAWMTTFLAEGYVDTFRAFEQGGGHYTWWFARPGVRERNIGWRIDYHLVSDDLRPQLRSARIHADVLGSDHCPVSLELSQK